MRRLRISAWRLFRPRRRAADGSQHVRLYLLTAPPWDCRAHCLRYDPCAIPAGRACARRFRGVCIVKPIIVTLALVMATVVAAAQTPAARTFDIYFIDVEGGQSTLIVTPARQTLLIDAGFPSTGTFDSRPGDPAKARDPQRILAVANVAGVSRIDYLLATHFHGDHIGGVPELAQLMPIGTFIDHGRRERRRPSGSRGTLAMHKAYAGGARCRAAPRAEDGAIRLH